MKTEYQGRGTPHWHIAAWVVCFGLLEWLKGRTGTAVVSAFVRVLSMLFHCEIDVQIGNGRLNYINVADGYIDLAAEEHTQELDEGRHTGTLLRGSYALAL
jgi:hypothetical protein